MNFKLKNKCDHENQHIWFGQTRENKPEIGIYENNILKTYFRIKKSQIKTPKKRKRASSNQTRKTS